MADGRPRIVFIGTGGSISTPGRDSLDLHEYADHGRTLEVDELLAMFPEVSRVADVRPVRFRAIISPAITPQDWIDLVNKVSEVVSADPDLDGIVITHGTDTVEETAYFLNLTVKVQVPVVLVAAQRPPNGLSSDAGLNLVNATRVAGSPLARGMGVLVVVNDEIQAARDVTKTSSFRLQTFRTPDLGILGQVDPDGSVCFYRRPLRRCAPDTPFDVRSRQGLPRVDIVYAYAGADGTLFEALVDRGAKGIVYAGLPSGIAPPAQRAAMIEAIRRGVLIVQSRRSPGGRLRMRTKDWDTGIVLADNLNPQKARVLAMVALATARGNDEIRRMFEEY